MCKSRSGAFQADVFYKGKKLLEKKHFSLMVGL